MKRTRKQQQALLALINKRETNISVVVDDFLEELLMELSYEVRFDAESAGIPVDEFIDDEVIELVAQRIAKYTRQFSERYC